MPKLRIRFTPYSSATGVSPWVSTHFGRLFLVDFKVSNPSNKEIDPLVLPFMPRKRIFVKRKVNIMSSPRGINYKMSGIPGGCPRIG